MFKLIWIAATITANGPVTGNIPETTKFKDKAECVSFGERMTPRLQDWVRGTIGADWDHGVGIRFSCEMSGDPA